MSDFVICVDTREPAPSPWEQYFSVPTEREKLDTGDYSIMGVHKMPIVGIERKTIDDLVGCLSHSRPRFENELLRARAFDSFWVVIEASYSDILAGRYTSKMSTKSAWESVCTMQMRYRIPFLFAGNPKTAAHLAESLLAKWLRERGQVITFARKASKNYDERAQINGYEDHPPII
jgi:DNA excision repair protein ERCC-4